MGKHIMKQKKQIHKEELKFYRNGELMMRSIKMYVPTLDKYVKRVSHKKEKEIFFTEIKRSGYYKSRIKK